MGLLDKNLDGSNFRLVNYKGVPNFGETHNHVMRDIRTLIDGGGVSAILLRPLVGLNNLT